jgi:hypothetical protein
MKIFLVDDANTQVAVYNGFQQADEANLVCNDK